MQVEPFEKPLDEATGESSKSPPKGYLLLVEDHDINQILIKAMTEELGYQTELAADGAEAVAWIDTARSENSPIDLVLMDLQMPVMDGFEATRMIRASGLSKHCLPIVAITANADQEDIDQCIAAGMQDHIAKPVMMQQLQSVLEQRISRNARAPVKPLKTNQEIQFSDELRSRYSDRRDQAIRSLKSLLDTGTFLDFELNEVSDHLHKLTGTAAMFGEPELGAQAKKIEDGLQNWKRSEKPKKIEQYAAVLFAISQTGNDVGGQF